MTATDELRRILTERGVRWSAVGKDVTIDNQTYCYPHTFTEFQDGLVVTNLTPQQAIAATLGERSKTEQNGVTAEQVREAIEHHFGRVAVLDDGKPVEWRDDWVCKVAIDYRAIADELNATLGAGESRYHKLFGTPERAARTLVDPLICNCVHCDECGARAMCDVACSCPTANDAENALLEWLKQEVNA